MVRTGRIDSRYSLEGKPVELAGRSHLRGKEESRICVDKLGEA